MNKVQKPINTPLLKVYDQVRNNTIYFKDETKQYTNAFKYRGVYNKFSKIDLTNYNGVITASTGNHGQAVSLVAKQLEIKCSIVIPHSTPTIKREKIKKNGAIIIDYEELTDYDKCSNYAIEKSKEDNLLYIPSFDDQDIIDGHKTLFDEIPYTYDYCFCPVGGGGLISAALTNRKLNNTKIIGVEIEEQDSMNQSLINHEIISVNIKQDNNSFCEGILVKKVGNLNFKIALENNLNMTTVTINDIKESIKRLNKLNIVAEGAGASSYAAYLNSNIKNSSILCVISGGNIDKYVFKSIVEERDL